MKKRFTFLIAAIAAILMMAQPKMVVGQEKTTPTTSDFTWPTPQLSENFNSLSETSGTGNTNNATTLTNLTAFGIFNKIYCGKAANTWAIESNNTFGSNVFKLSQVGNPGVIATITGKTYGTTGAFSFKVLKTSKCYIGLYGGDDNNTTNKSYNAVYLANNGSGALTFAELGNDGKTVWVSIGSFTTNDIIEVCVVYNTTNSATTYGNSIELGTKKAHVYVNGNCVMDGESPKDFTIPVTTLTVFRACPQGNSQNCTIDDVKIYNTLPTAASSDPTINVSPTSLTGFTYSHGNGPSAAQSFSVSGSSLSANLVIAAPTDYELCTTANGTYSESISLTPSSGAVSSTTIYARLKAGKGIGNYNSENVTLNSTGATEKTVALSGSVTGYTLTYSGNGNTSGTVPTDATAYEKGASVTILGNTGSLVKTHYSFGGWTRNIGSAPKTYAADDTLIIKANTTVNAVWTPITHTFSTAVTPNNSGTVVAKDGGNNTIASGSSVAETAQLTLTASPAEGYNFTSWSDGGNNSTLSSTTTNPTTFTMGTANVTITATFTARTHTTVTLHDGLNGATTTVVNTYTDATFADVIEGHDIATVNGWTALGWVKSYTSGTPTLITTSEAVGSTTDLFAVYSKGANIFTLINDVDDIALNGNYMIGYGSKIMKNVKSTNYMGYTTSNTISEGAFEYVDGRVFILGGTSGAYTFYDGSTYLSATDGEQYLGLTSGASTDYQKWSISFSGDYAMISNNGNSSNKNVSFYSKNDYFNCYTNDGAVVNLYKQTSSVNYSTTPSAEKCHVTYNANGATSGDVPTDNGEYNPNANVTVLGNTGSLVKTGHTWSGWCLNAEGTGTVYGPTPYTTTYQIPANTTFYAKWSVNTHTVTLPDNDAYGEYSMNKSNPVAYNTEVTLTYTKASGYDNYKATWSVNGTPIAGNKFNMPDADVTVTVSVEEMTQASYIFNTDAGLSDLSISKPNSGSGTNLGDATYSVGLVDMTCTNGSTATRVWNSNGALTLRVYSGGTLTFEVPSTPIAYVITKVEFGGTVNLTYGSNPATAVSNKTWTGQTNSITFTASDQSQITTITVTYARLRTLSFWVNGTEAPALEKGVANGAKIGTLPTTPSGIPSGYTFDGWMDLSNSDNYYGTSAPTMVTTNTVVSDDMLLAAVFHETSTSSNYTTLFEEFDNDVIDDDLYGVNHINGYVVASSFENHGQLVIKNGGILEMDDAQSLTNTTAANLIIEDGGRLITHNAVQATVKKEIKGVGDENWNATSGAEGWYFIASPVDGASFSTATVNQYDLYMLDWENEQWLNQKNNEHSALFANGFQRGAGYLYANKENLDEDNPLSFAGEIQPLNNEHKATVTLAVDGWNLIGNPLTCKVTVDKAFSELNDEGSGLINQNEGSAINPCRGIAVYGEEGDVVTFTKATSQNATAPSNNNSLQMTLSQTIATRGSVSSIVVDNAIVSFVGNSSLPKFSMLEGNAKIYIPQNNEQYAIVSSEARGEMPVCFKANRDGQFTINVNAENVEMSYLHLIDNIAGQDIDLIATPSYTFSAKGDDYESRFRLVFSANNENENQNENDDFAFVSNGEIIVNGTGILQIIDIMGRVISTKSTEERISTNGMTPGVYVLRLIGNDTKTQKIVVK